MSDLATQGANAALAGVGIPISVDQINSVLNSIGLGNIPPHVTGGLNLSDPKVQAILSIPSVQTWVKTTSDAWTASQLSMMSPFQRLTMTGITTLQNVTNAQIIAVQNVLAYQANNSAITPTTQAILNIQSTSNNIPLPSSTVAQDISVQYPNAATASAIQVWINANPGIKNLPPGLLYVNYLGIGTNGQPSFTGGVPILNPNVPANFVPNQFSYLDLIKDLVFVPFMPLIKLKG